MVALELAVELVDAAVDFTAADVACPEVVVVDLGIDELLADVVDGFAVVCDDAVACELVEAAAELLADADVVATGAEDPLVDVAVALAGDDVGGDDVGDDDVGDDDVGDDDVVGGLVGIATEVPAEVELPKPDKTTDATASALLTMLATSTVVPDEVPTVVVAPDDAAAVDEADGLATVAKAVDAETKGSTVAVVGLVGVVELAGVELVVVFWLLDDVVDVVPEAVVAAEVPDEPLAPDVPFPEDDDVVELPLDDPDDVVELSADAMPDRIELRLTIDSPCMKQGACGTQKRV
ncbi:hypothetical protein [Schlesneria paludicola]|uniref:hypothetical protein n=1 Tax=Schlesneria paludicola TaxID=360056 RepID=UPI00029B43C9|nr:hypothetical protein [Schlesneria paludicola]